MIIHFKRRLGPPSPPPPDNGTGPVAIGSSPSGLSLMVLPPLSMDLGLLLISIGVVNLWKARQS